MIFTDLSFVRNKCLQFSKERAKNINLFFRNAEVVDVKIVEILLRTNNQQFSRQKLFSLIFPISQFQCLFFAVLQNVNEEDDEKHTRIQHEWMIHHIDGLFSFAAILHHIIKP